MALYRCYFADSADYIFDVQEIETDTDVGAVNEAASLVADRPLCVAEVWEDSRLVRKRILPRAPARKGQAVRPAAQGAQV